MIDGDSLAHRAYHAMPKSIRLNGVARLRQHGLPAVGGGAAAGGARRLGHLEVPTYRHEAFEPYQSGRVFEESLLEQLDAAAAARRRDRIRQREGRRLRGGRLPRRGGRVRGEARRRGARGDLRPRRCSSSRASATTILQPVRGVYELARIGPAEVRRALRRRAGAGAGLHRAPRRPVRQAARRTRRRAEEGRRRPARIRLAGGRTRGRPLLRRGGGSAALPANRHDGRLRPTPSPHDQMPTWAEASSLAEDWGLNAARRAAGEVA